MSSFARKNLNILYTNIKVTLQVNDACSEINDYFWQNIMQEMNHYPTAKTNVFCDEINQQNSTIQSKKPRIVTVESKGNNNK